VRARVEGPRLRPLQLPFIAAAEKCGILTAILPALSLQGPNKKCPSDKLLAFHTLDVSTQRAQLVFDTFITTVDVIDTIDDGHAIGDATGQYQAG
jgi:hypothetical protein